jgi:hypothetical protein
MLKFHGALSYFVEQDVACGIGPASPHRLLAAIGD